MVWTCAYEGHQIYWTKTIEKVYVVMEDTQRLDAKRLRKCLKFRSETTASLPHAPVRPSFYDPYPPPFPCLCLSSSLIL